MTYELGVVISFSLLCFDQLFFLFRLLTSCEFSNYRDINFFYHPFSGKFFLRETMPTFGSQVFNYLLLLVFTIPFLFLSWIYIGYRAYSFIVALNEAQLVPDTVKIHLWKLKNARLPQDHTIMAHLEILGIYSEKNQDALQKEIARIKSEAA